MEHIAEYLRYADFERGFLQLPFTLFVLALVLERFHRLFITHRRAPAAFVDTASDLLRTRQLEEVRAVCRTARPTIESRLLTATRHRVPAPAPGAPGARRSP